jgi:hypothetical protein
MPLVNELNGESLTRPNELLKAIKEKYAEKSLHTNEV